MGGAGCYRQHFAWAGGHPGRPDDWADGLPGSDDASTPRITMKTVWEILRKTFGQCRDDGALVQAAALAFYAAISLAPMVTIILAFASLFYGEVALRGELVAQVKRYVGPSGAEVIQDILVNARRSGSDRFTIVSVGILLAGSSAVFARLQKALNTVWNVAPKPHRRWQHTLKARLVSVALVLGIGMLLLAFTLAGVVLSGVANFVTRLSIPGAQTLWQSVNFLLGVAACTGLFALLLKFLPDAVIRWRDVWLGALATSTLFNVGRLGIGFYLGRFAPGSAYGTAGSLFAVLLWLFYSAVILLFGAELTQVLARRFGTRIRPAAHAHRTSTLALPVDDDGNPLLPEEARAAVRERVAEVDRSEKP